MSNETSGYAIHDEDFEKKKKKIDPAIAAAIIGAIIAGAFSVIVSLISLTGTEKLKGDVSRIDTAISNIDTTINNLDLKVVDIKNTVSTSGEKANDTTYIAINNKLEELQQEINVLEKEFSLLLGEKSDLEEEVGLHSKNLTVLNNDVDYLKSVMPTSTPTPTPTSSVTPAPSPTPSADPTPTPIPVPVLLTTIDSLLSKQYIKYTESDPAYSEGFVMGQKTYNNGFTFNNDGADSWSLFELVKGYKLLKAKVGFVDGYSSDSKAVLRIYADEILIKEVQLKYDMEIYELELPVTDVDTLKLSLEDQFSLPCTFGIVEALLYPKNI